ncbi:MAG: hypothetical protein ACRYF3_06370 [Janthinobacterium lividum]
MAHRRGLSPNRPVVVTFTARLLVHGSARGVFAVLTDWPRQTAWVPATVVERRGGPVGEVGERFAGVSRLGPFVLDDAMTVVGRRAPEVGRAGVVEIVKTGDVLGGTVSIAVRSAAGTGVQVEWTENIVVRPLALRVLARLGGPVPAWVGRLAFEAVLRAARPELEGRG